MFTFATVAAGAASIPVKRRRDLWLCRRRHAEPCGLKGDLSDGLALSSATAGRWHSDPARATLVQPLATTPRHLLVPPVGDQDHQQRRRGHVGAAWGRERTEAWMRDVYADTTLVTRIGRLHADHAEVGQTLSRGRDRRSTSSSTRPALADDVPGRVDRRPLPTAGDLWQRLRHRSGLCPSRGWRRSPPADGW